MFDNSKMRDRMQDLERGEAEESEAPAEEKQKKSNWALSKKHAKVAPEVTSDSMNEFFAKVAEIKAEIFSAGTLLASLQEIHSQTLDAITDEQLATSAGNLDETMIKIQGKHRIIQGALQTMSAETKNTKAVNEVVIRESQYSVLLRLFSDEIIVCKSIQEQHQIRLKERLKKHALVVNPLATAAEIERVVQGEKVFAPQNLLQRTEARKALNLIQQKHQDVVKLTESIIELQQLFVEITVLVADQGIKLDKTASHVDNAVGDTEKGVENMDEALKKQKKARKFMRIILGLLIVAVLLVHLQTYLGGWNSSIVAQALIIIFAINDATEIDIFNSR